MTRRSHPAVSVARFVRRSRRSAAVLAASLLLVVGVAVLGALTGSGAFDEELRSREAVERLVSKAAAYARENGRDAALAAFSAPGGEFHVGELYVYAYDFSGTVLAHGGDPSLVGRNLIGQTDVDGVPVVQALLRIALDGSGWLRYTWPNPAHGNALEPKQGYVERIGEDWLIGSGFYVPTPALDPINVQLKWYHQAQFAGIYAAQDQGFFAAHGVRVNAIPSDAPQDANPVAGLVDGSADVAVASMAQAVAASTGGRRFVNIAQIFQDSDSVLLCRFGPGRVAPRDLRTATVASSPDREPAVRELMGRIFPGGGEVTYVRQLPDIASLSNGDADCLWGSQFNEQPQAADAGLAVFIVRPEDYGVTNIEDGLYVDADRLRDADFRRSLLGLLLGLDDGWAFARRNPEAAVQLVLAQPSAVSRSLGENAGSTGSSTSAAHERHQLASVLDLIGDDRFGFFDVSRYEKVDGLGAPELPPSLRDRLWTHDIWNAAAQVRGNGFLISPVTEHYLALLRASFAYRLMLEIGVFAAAVAGALLAIRQRYRIWGMYVVAGVTALGGGVVRDLLLGGNRLPIWLLHDPTDLIVVGAAVLVVWASANLLPSGVLRIGRYTTYADVIGFAIIAANGVVVALIAGAAPYWAPIAAATSVAGGGILSDILVNREHEGFTGVIYEEGAVIGAIGLVGLLLIANANEHQPWLVLAALLVAIGGLLAFRYSVLRHALSYPPLGFPFASRQAGGASD